MVDESYEEGFEPVGSPHTLSDSHHDCKLIGGDINPTDCMHFKDSCLSLQGTCHVTGKEKVEKIIEDRISH